MNQPYNQFDDYDADEQIQYNENDPLMDSPDYPGLLGDNLASSPGPQPSVAVGWKDNNSESDGSPCSCFGRKKKKKEQEKEKTNRKRRTIRGTISRSVGKKHFGGAFRSDERARAETLRETTDKVAKLIGTMAEMDQFIWKLEAMVDELRETYTSSCCLFNDDLRMCIESFLENYEQIKKKHMYARRLSERAFNRKKQRDNSHLQNQSLMYATEEEVIEAQRGLVNTVEKLAQKEQSKEKWEEFIEGLEDRYHVAYDRHYCASRMDMINIINDILKFADTHQRTE